MGGGLLWKGLVGSLGYIPSTTTPTLGRLTSLHTLPQANHLLLAPLYATRGREGPLPLRLPRDPQDQLLLLRCPEDQVPPRSLSPGLSLKAAGSLAWSTVRFKEEQLLLTSSALPPEEQISKYRHKLNHPQGNASLTPDLLRPLEEQAPLSFLNLVCWNLDCVRAPDGKSFMMLLYADNSSQNQRVQLTDELNFPYKCGLLERNHFFQVKSLFYLPNWENM